MSKLFYITHADVDCRSYFFFQATTVKGTGRCEQVKKKKKQRKQKKICHRACILNHIAFAQAADKCSLKLESLEAETKAGFGWSFSIGKR